VRTFTELARYFRFLSSVFSAWGQELAEFTDQYHDHWVLGMVCAKIASPGAVFCLNVSFGLDRGGDILDSLQELIERVEYLESLVDEKEYELFLPYVKGAEAPTANEVFVESLREGIRGLPG